MTHRPRLIQLISDARIGALIMAPKPALLLDGEGNLLFANRASLTLLRAASGAEVAAGVAAEKGRLAASLRRILDAPADDPGQRYTLAFVVGGARKAVEFIGTRLAVPGGGGVLLVGTEPVGGAPEPEPAATALIGIGPDALAVVDGGGRLIAANPSAAAMMGGALNVSEVVPAAHDALARAREQGAAEHSFGALSVVFARIGATATSPIIAAFSARMREDAQPGDGDGLSAGNDPAAAPEPAENTAPISFEQIREAGVRPPTAETGVHEAAATPSPRPAPASETVPPRALGRFVWQTDAEGRFTSVSPELAAAVGNGPASIAGLTWEETAARFGVDGVRAVVAAMARRDTWSGISVTWPAEDAGSARPVDLAALPVFDRERRFLGFRGFGVFREAVPIAIPQPAPSAADPTRRQAPAEPPPPPPSPPTPVLIEKPENVVPLHKTPAPRPTLTPVERNAFREIARAIGARMKRVESASARPREPLSSPPAAGAPLMRAAVSGERAVLDRLPIGVIVHRAERLLYANRTLLDWVGFASLEELTKAGGLARLFTVSPADDAADADGARPIALRSQRGEPIPVEARLLSALWEGESALVYVLQRAGAGLDERMEAGELALREAEANARELRAILDTATDGVALLDREGRVLGMNRSAEALFGFDSNEIEGRHFSVLFAPESHRAAADYLDGLAVNGVASVLNDGREVIGRVREGGLIPLFMTLGRVGEGSEKFCAVFRDITQWKRAEQELVHSRREAERASSAKSEFLAKISHEIRTPLNAIIGFAEVMMEERLGPVGNERYREYLKDIHASGEHLVSLINDLLDLSKIEAGKLDLAFSSVDLNEIASQSMALMQPQANRERIIIRTALAVNLPPVVADARSIRQIVLNLLSNSIRFTPPGGQVIVSTTFTETGEVHLRVRDTGIGMSETEIKTALEPFRQIATSGRGKTGGTGLGLPLTKALVEANRATFSIKSTVNAGTLVEIAFPSTRVLAE
jgi:PAS domain S-box-containing protein